VSADSEYDHAAMASMSKIGSLPQLIENWRFEADLLKTMNIDIETEATLRRLADELEAALK